MRRTPLVRRAALAAATPMLLLALTSCGSDDADKAKDDSAQTSETKKADTESAADVEAGEEVDPQAFADEMAAAYDDLTTAHMTMKMEGGTIEMTAEGDADYSTKLPTIAMKMTNSAMGAEQMDVRMIDGTVYASIPGMTNGKFISLDKDDPNNPLGKLTDQFDPRSTMESLGKSIKKVVFVGEEDVDGESLRHYTLTVDTAEQLKLAEQLAPGSGAKANLPKEMTYEIWLDDESRTRRTVIDMGGNNGKVTTEMSKWGEPVDIEAPAKSEIVEMPTGASPAA